jgi:hypothetical protein
MPLIALRSQVLLIRFSVTVEPVEVVVLEWLSGSIVRRPVLVNGPTASVSGLPPEQ